MNRLTLLLTLMLASVALGGCVGEPAPGPTVNALVVARDAATGEPLAWSLSSATIDGTISAETLRTSIEGTLGLVPAEVEALMNQPLVDATDVAEALEASGDLAAFGVPVSFQAGTGNSGFGERFEDRVLSSATAGDELSFRVGRDPTLEQTRTVTTPAFLGSSPAEGEVDLPTFEAQIGPAVVNETFEFNAIYDAIVVAVEGGMVTYRFHIEGGRQEDPADVVGAVLVSTVDGDMLVRTLEPNVGATFTIQPPTQFQPSPLGLEPGSYTTVGIEDEELVYELSTLQYPELVGRDLSYDVHVLSIQATVETAELGDDYGARQSPVVEGDPTMVDDHGHAHDEPADDHAREDAADDGHDDGHDHQH